MSKGYCLLMNWSDTGFLISKSRYSENSLIVEFFTENHGKAIGLIFGGTSKKIKNYLQIGNKFHINYNSKSETRIGYFKVEILKALTPLYFDHNKKLSCITSATSLIRLLTADNQSNKKIYDLIDNFFVFLDNDQWIKKYIFWELELLKLIGYDLELKNIVIQEEIDNEIFYYVKSATEKKKVPSFLIKDDNEHVNTNNLVKGFKLVSDYLEKSVLRPNNINFPISRSNFLNLIK